MNNVFEAILKSKQKFPHNIALKNNTESISYTELLESVDNLSNFLLYSGISSRDKIAFIAENTPNVIVAIISCLKIGCTVICIHPKSNINTINYIINDAQISAVFSNINIPNIIFPKSYKNLHLDIRKGINDVFQKNYRYKNFELMNSSLPNLDDLAFIIYTSGSTGNPKGVMVTHRNILFTTHAINKHLNNNTSDRILSYLPLSFDYGLYQIFLSLFFGATLYIYEASIFPNNIHKLIENEKITALPGTRGLFNLIFEKCTKRFYSLRYTTNTGESITKKNIDKIKESCPNVSIFLMYGQTECKRVSILPAEYLDIKNDSVGIPLSGTKAFVVNNNMTLCKPYEIGELYVAGPNVCNGYWNKPCQTNQKFLYHFGERLLKTGDLFYMDNNGFLYFCGRNDRMFKSRGYIVEPVKIERTIESLISSINDIVVLPIPDDLYGNKIGLIITADNDWNDEELFEEIREACKKNLDPWYEPHFIFRLNTIPTTVNGKIDRNNMLKYILDNLLERRICKSAVSKNN